MPLVDLEELPDEALLMPCGGVGAPTVSIEKIESGDEGGRLREMVETLWNRRVVALMSAEIGGSNGIIPVVWAARIGLPVVDADGMGRPLDIAPLACIPTTAGTGSEVSMAAVIKDPAERVKIEIADFPLFPRLAILDPDTTRTLPPAVAAATGMDAMTHAIEGYVSVDWSPHQDARSLQALRMIRDNLERAVQREPLWRIHEAVFAVLALESEPVDPRL